jgi:hypothetical protein
LILRWYVARQFLAARKDELQPSTYADMERHLLQHCKPLHGLNFSGVTQANIATRLNEIKTAVGGATGNRVRTSLSGLFAWAMQPQVQKARLVNVSVRSIQRAGRVLRLAPELGPLIQAGKLTVGFAEQLAKEPDLKAAFFDLLLRSVEAPR